MYISSTLLLKGGFKLPIAVKPFSLWALLSVGLWLLYYSLSTQKAVCSYCCVLYHFSHLLASSCSKRTKK